MKNFPLTQIAFRNVTLNWRQTAASLISISAGFMSLSLFQGYMIHMGSMYEETFSHRGMFGHILIEKEGAQSHGIDDAYRFSLNSREQSVIDDFLNQEKNQVLHRVRFLQVSGMITNGQVNLIFAGFGYDLKDGALMRGQWAWNTLAGSPLQLASIDNSITLGQTLGAALDCLPKKKESFLTGAGGYKAEIRPFQCARDRFQLSVTTYAGQLNTSDASVSGLIDAVFKEIDSKHVAMSLGLAQRLLDTKSVSMYSVELGPRTDVPSFASRLQKFAASHDVPLDVKRWQEHPYGDMYVRTMDFLGIFRNFVVMVILAIVGLSILNTQNKTVSERTREIGTLRSLGFKPRQVMALFAMEAGILAVFGSSIGLVMTLLLSAIVNALGFSYRAGLLAEPIPFRIAYDSKTYLLSAAFLFVLAVLTAIVTTRRTVTRPVSVNLIHA